MRMGYYDSISSYEADITLQYGYAMYSEAQTAATGALGQEPAAAYLEDSGDTDTDDTNDGRTARSAGNLEASLMDQLSQLLEEQQEQALARARDPLSSLFDYYLEIQKVGEADEEQALLDGNPVDESQVDDTEASFSDLLEIAAKAVDRTIGDMLKNAFDNTLKYMI
jgi:hypothetical protein